MRAPSRILTATLLACLILCLSPKRGVLASAYNGHPRLVVIIVIDQFRGDYLNRHRADFKNRGFNLFM